MSRENVKIVQAGFDAWNEGDMNFIRDSHDPDVIMRALQDGPEPGPFVGRDAVMRQFEHLRDTWDADTIEPISDPIVIGDRVVVRFIWHVAGRGPKSGLELTSVYTVRKGRIFYIEQFRDHAEALEAAGPPA